MLGLGPRLCGGPVGFSASVRRPSVRLTRNPQECNSRAVVWRELTLRLRCPYCKSAACGRAVVEQRERRSETWREKEREGKKRENERLK